MTSLAIVERGYRGALEVSYFDALFLGIEIHRQLGLEVLLRGDAATYAVRNDDGVEALRIGGGTVTTLNDPRSDLVRLRDLGVQIWVETEDLETVGVEPDRLLPGVHGVRANEFATRWPDFDRIFFL